jgi:hypothetical protein
MKRTLRDIVARLKLKYKIINGMIYGVIEKDDELPYPTMRPASKNEIVDIQAREVTKAILKAHTKEK